MTLVYANHVSQSYRLVQNKIVVYLLDCSKFYHQVENFKQLLSDDELIRAQRYVEPHLQSRFIVQHGITRQILAYHLHIQPEEIEIEAPKYGKPQVSGIHFNISHSDDYLAVAISKDVPVGIDIESMDRNVDLNHVAAIVLSDAERFNLFSLPQSEQKMTLLRTWVCKEAYWKFVGEGLNSQIKQLEVVPTYEKDYFLMQGGNLKHNTHRIQSFASMRHRLVGAVAHKGSTAEIIFRFDEIPVLI